MYKTYWKDVKQFNDMYGRGNLGKPRIVTAEELRNFKKILEEELSEVDSIINLAESDDVGSIAIATEMADWLGDIIVYCSTKASQIGIDLRPVLEVIMQSNFSKLGKDGEPIIDERGKVMKGPNYWKPEPKIRELLLKTLQEK